MSTYIPGENLMDFQIIILQYCFCRGGTWDYEMGPLAMDKVDIEMTCLRVIYSLLVHPISYLV